MSEYQVHIPSPEGYRLFLNNLKNPRTDDEKKFTENLKQEENLLHKFSDKPENTDRDIVKERAKELSSSYKTRIPDKELQEIVEIILKPGFDERLDLDGLDSYNLVDKLRRVNRPRTKTGLVDHFSFATKYCHHCRPNKYPIYDSINACVLSVFLGYKDKRNYKDYVEFYKRFCSLIGRTELEKNEGFYIDKYIQAIGNHSSFLFE